MFERSVISKKNKAIEGLENKCALWEDRWQQKRRKRLVKILFIVITAILIPILSWFVPKWLSGNKGEVKPELATKLRITTVDPNTGKTALNIRTKERVEELKNFIIKEKIDPWLFIRHSGLKVAKDDGSIIESSGFEYAGSVINIFWSKDYIDPFLSKGIKRILDETGQECRTNGLRAEEPLKEAAALLNGIIWNIYDRMVELDFKLRKQRGDSEKVFKKSVDGKIQAMDAKLREHLRAALELYSDPSK